MVRIAVIAYHLLAECGSADFAYERSGLYPKFLWYFSVLHRRFFRTTIAGHFSLPRYFYVPPLKCTFSTSKLKAFKKTIIMALC